MKNLNSTKKKIPEKDRKASVNDPSKLLAEFFNGVVIHVEGEYGYES